MRHPLPWLIGLTLFLLVGCGGAPESSTDGDSPIATFTVQFMRYQRSVVESEYDTSIANTPLKIHDAMQAEMRSEKLITAILNGRREMIRDVDSEFDQPVAETAKEISNATTFTIQPQPDDMELVVMKGNHKHPIVVGLVLRDLVGRYQYRMSNAMAKAYRAHEQARKEKISDIRKHMSALETDHLRLLTQNAPKSAIESVKRKSDALQAELKSLEPTITTVALTYYSNTETVPPWLLDVFEMTAE